MNANDINASAYKELPAGTPPLGQTPNYDHPRMRAYGAQVGMGIGLAAASILFLLRVYVKAIITRKWSWEDSTCLLALLLLIAFNAVFFFLMRPTGIFARHIWDVPLGKLTKGNLQALVGTVNLYMAAAFVVKLSLFLFYLRLFKPFRLTRWLTYIGIVVCGLFYASLIISSTVLCTPPPGRPNDDLAWGFRFYQCVHPMLRVSLVQAVFSMVSDIYVLAIPVYSIFQLHLSFERKVGVSTTFAVGIIAIACSIGSVVWRCHLYAVEDETWVATTSYIFSSAELSAGIICSCMPILSPLFRKHFLSRPMQLSNFSWRRLFSRKTSNLSTSHTASTSRFQPVSIKSLHLGWTKKGTTDTIDDFRTDKTVWETWSDRSVQKPDRVYGHQLP